MDGGPSEGSRGREATGKSVHNMAVRVVPAGRQAVARSSDVDFFRAFRYPCCSMASPNMVGQRRRSEWDGPGARGRLLLRRLSRPQQSREEFFDSAADAVLRVQF